MGDDAESPPRTESAGRLTATHDIRVRRAAAESGRSREHSVSVPQGASHVLDAITKLQKDAASFLTACIEEEAKDA